MVDSTPSDQSDLPSIAGYEINRRLGQGGMGIVYKALRLNDLRWVALKMIVGTRPDLKQRFRREVSAVAKLRHPGIVELYDTGEHAGWPFFTMELVEGGNLAERRDHYVGDYRRSAALVEALARAVHCAHELGIVHRDLKPGNILLAENGDPKISDFGLAKSLDAGEESLTNTSAIMGTPAYMAPEVARGEMRDAGPAVDVYALGAILYELLTGQLPFPGKNQLVVLDLIRSRPPLPPGQLRPGLPRALEALCLRCLEKGPLARPASALELADLLPAALLDAATTGAIGGDPTTPTSRVDPQPTVDHVPRNAEPTPSTTDRPSLPDVPGFEALELLRVEGTARVYRARQTRLGRAVSLWVARREHLDAVGLERFRIEAEVLSRLQHPNIVQLIDVGEQDGFLYRIEEYLDGGTLANRLKRGPMAEGDAVALVATLARALHHVHHALGDLVVVYRNLKPAAVQFTAAGVAKLVDFSLVHAPALGTEKLEREGAVVGAPPYLAPEQIRGPLHDLGPGTDVFALGGLLYACLTGRPPHGFANPYPALQERILNDPPAPLRQYNPSASKHVVLVCLKALEKEPYHRYASALELAEELERAKRGWFG